MKVISGAHAHSQVTQGLLFEASEFGDIETTDLPDTVSITVDEAASIAVGIGDEVLTGQPVTTPNDNIVASHASVSGVVTDITLNTITIKSDGLDKPYRHDTPQLRNRSDYQNHFRAMGLAGLGGAAFPVDKKLAAPEIKTLLINAAECDPAIYCDEALMQARPAAIIEGIKIAMETTGAHQCIIGIEENKTSAIAAIKEHLPDSIKLVTVPAIYPSGAEKILHRLCTGKIGSLRDNQAVCFNIATCYAMQQSVEHSKPLISRIVTVVQGSGIRNFEMRIGTPIKTLQTQLDEPLPESLICGGQMMGWPVTQSHCVDKSTNSILLRAHNNRKALPCIRCGACEEVCPESLYPQQLFWHTTPHNSSALKELKLDHCIECACCDVVCPSNIPLAELFGNAKRTINHETIEEEKAALAKYRYEKRLARENNKTIRQRKELDAKTAELTEAQKSADAKKALIAKALQRNKNKKSSVSDNRPGQDTHR